jgi:simple sugar transport system permease protein
MIVALAGVFAERSGIINLALEGIMIFGAFIGVLFVRLMQQAEVFQAAYDAGNWIALQGFELLAMLVAAIMGAIFSLLLSFASINLKADQTIGGTALNLLATAIAMVIAKRINGNDSPKIAYNSTTNQVLSNLNFSFNIGPLTVNWFIVIALVAVAVAWFILYRSRFGMRLMSCGEHPQAAASVGINVYKMRWAGVLMSGLLGGIGGMAYVVPAVGDWNFEMGVAGMGFLALAVMIFGQWKPVRIAAAALFFAVFRAMANIFDSIGFLNALNLPKEIYNMMPYVASMVVLAFTSKKSRAPKAEGIPYDKGTR